MKQKQNNKISNCEEKLLNNINCIFMLPYNMGIVILTVVLFFVSHCFMYSANGDFDMTIFVGNSVMLFSATTILASFISQNNKDCNQRLLKLSLLTFTLNILSIIMQKVLLFQSIGVLILSPIVYFCFFLIIKHMYLSQISN